jgi:hypothetical protein
LVSLLRDRMNCARTYFFEASSPGEVVVCLRRAEVESLPLEEDIHRLLLEHTQAAGIEGRSSESNSLVWLWPALRRALRAWGAAALDQHPPLLLALRLFFQCLVHTGGCLQGSQLTLSPELATDSPAVLQEILAFTKDLLYRLCWLDRSSLKVFLPDRPPHVLALLEDAKEAFNALFQRHSRLKLLRDAARSPFRDEDFLFPPLPKEDITPEVVLGLGLEAEDEGGHFVGGGEHLVAGGGGGGGGEGGGSAIQASSAMPAARRPSVGGRLRAERVLLILNCFPQTVPFATRASLFRSLAATRNTTPEFGLGGARIRVRRTHIVEDAFRAFEKLTYRKSKSALLGRLSISFISADVSARARRPHRHTAFLP